MRPARWMMGTVLAGALAAAPPAWAVHRGLDVELWTDRGHDAVYQPGDAIEVRVRVSDDAYLLVYEIDSVGRVRHLFPERGSRGFIEGRRTLRVPSERSHYDLVVEGPVGQGYIVAVASREPLGELPWYLRPYDPHAAGVGYVGRADDEEGVTAEGRIVGDPFVAMERIRRRVLEDADDPEAFATAYASYYVDREVRYPRYLCNDCHRPHRWAWWDGFDPYYATCSVFDFRVNWGWTWGPTYWFGYVPYYYYMVRADCPPRYRVVATRHARYSGWDGWPRWSSLWGGSLIRYKSKPPADYAPPHKYRAGDPSGPGARVRSGGTPPGFLVGGRGEPRQRQDPSGDRAVGRRDLGRGDPGRWREAGIVNREAVPRVVHGRPPAARAGRETRGPGLESRGPGRGGEPRVSNPSPVRREGRLGASRPPAREPGDDRLRPARGSSRDEGAGRVHREPRESSRSAPDGGRAERSGRGERGSPDRGGKSGD